MSDRIHLMVKEAEKERYRREAEREGLSLSEWLSCDRRERGTEPDWNEHRRLIEESIGQDRPPA